MFNSKAKYLYSIYRLVKKIILIPSSLILLVLITLNIFYIIPLIPQQLYLSDNPNSYMKLLINLLFFGIIMTCLNIPFIFFEAIFKNKCIKVFNFECLEIINETKLPKALPKVLYVYTTHNDLIESRVIQNMKQTYKNFEVWVSDGSDKKEWREKVKNFCSKNNINLFQLGADGSKNKADNLNQFLKNYKSDYDYLLIGDADEVFHSNFVEYAVKIFCSNKVKKLAYVVPLNICYRSKGIFPNAIRILDSQAFFWNIVPKIFSKNDLPDLGGQSCLISKKKLIECYGIDRFDDGNLEDWYLESMMVEKNYIGFIIPSTPCYFEPDVNIQAHFNRIMRVDDWRIRWWKIRTKNIIKNYTSRYSNWYLSPFFTLIKPLIYFISFSFFSFFIWVFYNWFSFAFKDNVLFWIFIGLILFIFFSKKIIKIVLLYKVDFNVFDGLCLFFLWGFWQCSTIIFVFKHWFKSFILGKYSQFGGSGNYRFIKSKSKTIRWWLFLIFLSFIIILFNSLIFSKSNILNSWNTNWLIFFFNIYVGVFWMSCFSYLVIWYVNHIPYNVKFNREDSIECKNVFEK